MLGEPAAPLRLIIIPPHRGVYTFISVFVCEYYEYAAMAVVQAASDVAASTRPIKEPLVIAALV